MGGIATRVAVLSSLVVLTATATVGFLVYRGAQDSLIQSASERVAHTAETVKVGMWGRMGAIGDDVQFLTEAPPVQGIVRARMRRGLDPEFAMRDDEWGVQLAQTFRSFLESRASFLQARFVGLVDGGRELVRVERKDGEVVFADVADFRTLGEERYIRRAAELPRRSLFFSDIMESDGQDALPANVPIVIISTPVYTESGEIFGVVAVTVDFHGAVAPMESLVDENQTLYIADHLGDLRHTYATASERPALEHVEGRFPSVQSVVEGSVNNVRLLNARLGDGSLGIAYFEMIPMSGAGVSPQLLVGVSEPHETILAGVRNVRNTSALITLLLAVASIALALTMSRYITDPIRQISKAVATFGGDGDRMPLPVGREDEIGLLARSFKSMERQIQDQIRILEDEERRQRTILETAAEGVIVATENGRIETFNPAATKIFNVAADDVVGGEIEKLLPTVDLESGTVDGEPIRTTGIETAGRRGDGAEIPLSVVWSSFKWREENRYTILVQDISERKEAGEAQQRLVRALESERKTLRELSRTLEARVQQRTAELERLNRELKASNRELSEIASVASHDLQEPLRKLRSFADLLEAEYGDLIDADARFYVQRIFELAERMSRLLNDLLAFSSVTSQIRAVKQVDLRSVALDAVEGLESTISASGGAVHVDDLPEIEADPRQIRQLFENLLENALSHRRPDVAPVVHVRGMVKEEPTGRSVCSIEVEDNGIGFDEKYRDRIFTPFQRLHGRRGPDGTGMGLTICRRIVENHLGTISARSTPGMGSTFIVTLPTQVEWEG
jgi:PAS domain S-box-containing protein